MSKKERMKRGLLKVGELAKLAGVLPSTVRYYTGKGILAIAARTPGGNCLYEGPTALARISIVRQMSGCRPSLADVMEKMEVTYG